MHDTLLQVISSIEALIPRPPVQWRNTTLDDKSSRRIPSITNLGNIHRKGSDERAHGIYLGPLNAGRLSSYTEAARSYRLFLLWNVSLVLRRSPAAKHSGTEVAFQTLSIR